jgi:hypothetical protein
LEGFPVATASAVDRERLNGGGLLLPARHKNSNDRPLQGWGVLWGNVVMALATYQCVKTKHTSWRIMAHHGASWRIMAHHGASWRIMAHHGASWRIMAHHG